MKEPKHLETLAVALLLITFFGFFAVKVWDIDFWWHIAAGRDIVLNGAIPSADPFGIYDADNACGQTVLKSGWLGQVLLYLLYRWFDLDGIIYFRAATLTACLAIVYWRCRRAGTAGLFALAITALAGLAILQHTGERPQLLSFLFMALIFLLLDEFLRSGKRWLLYGVPLVMLVWSNTHGGVAMGMVALGLFGAVHVFRQRWTIGRFDAAQTGPVLVTVGLGVAIPLLSPSGWDTFECIMIQQGDSFIRDRVSEYASPWELWPVTLYYWVFAGVALASMPVLLNKTHLEQGALVVVLGGISTISYRYIPLFVLAVAPYVAASLERMLGRVRLPAAPVNLFALAVALTFLVYGFKQERIFQRGPLENKFPYAAVDFIETNQLGGRMFNTMNWGGYLLWNLHGRVQIFIDGRTLDVRRMVPYTHILWMTPEGKQFFEQANFDLALVPYGNVFSREKYPLVPYLLNHPDWRVAYQDKSGYLFARRTQ